MFNSLEPKILSWLRRSTIELRDATSLVAISSALSASAAVLSVALIVASSILAACPINWFAVLSPAFTACRPVAKRNMLSETFFVFVSSAF